MLVFCIWERPHSFSCFYLPALFDTTSRALGGGLELCWRASRASHPSEDLSEPPPLLVSVAGREYHYVLTESLRNSLPRLFSSGWGSLGTLFGRLLCRLCPHRWSWRILRIAFRFSHGPSGNVFQSPDMTAGRGVFQSAERGNSLSSHYIIGRGEAQNETPFKNFFANSSN